MPGLARYQCPSCSTVVESENPSTLVCPSCGYGSSGGASRPQGSPQGGPAGGSPSPYSPQYSQSQPSQGPGGYSGQHGPPGGGFGTPTPYGGQQGYGSQPPGQKRTPGVSVAALVLGIIGLCLAGLYGVGLILGGLAIVFGILGIKGANERPYEVGGKGLATAGLVLGIIAVVVGLLWLAFLAAFWEEIMQDIEEQVILRGL